MHDKNEGIYLWMLEQDRQKNRVHALEQTSNSTSQLTKAAHDLIFNNKASSENEKEQSPVRNNADLEQLLNKIASLEEESRNLDKEQKQVDLRIRILCQNLIEELEKRDSQKQQAIRQLRERIGTMETQFQELVASDVYEKVQAGSIDGKSRKWKSETIKRSLDSDQDGVIVEIVYKVKEA